MAEMSHGHIGPGNDQSAMIIRAEKSASRESLLGEDQWNGSALTKTLVVF